MANTADALDALNSVCDAMGLPNDVRSIHIVLDVDSVAAVVVERTVVDTGNLENAIRTVLESYELRRIETQELQNAED